MKTPKIVLAAALATIGFSNLAYAFTDTAQVDIYLSGAPATRVIWNTALYDLVNVNGATITKYWTGSTYSTANQIVLTGGQINGTTVTIYGSWTGSTGGNQSVAITPYNSQAALKVAFLDPANLTAAGGGYTLGTTNEQYPHINLSDTFQDTIPFHGLVKTTHPHTTYDNLTEATPASPAVTGFVWVTNNGATTAHPGLTNFTGNQAYQLFQVGPTRLSFFTGNAADASTNLYPVGRDIASGARYAMLAETGIGTDNDANVIQYEPTLNTAQTQITNNTTQNTATTINLIPVVAGNGGYPSFSNVLTVLKAASSDPVGYIITYVTDSDAITAVNGGATALNWNGVPYSVGAIQQGTYTFWTYLHVFYDANNVGTNVPSLVPTFANALSYQLSTDTATGAILSSSLQVQREGDGNGEWSRGAYVAP